MKQFFTFLGIVAMGATAYGQADTDIVNIPDENFKKYLLSYCGNNTQCIDANGDGEISYREAKTVKEIRIDAWSSGAENSYYANIKDVTGLEAFVNIELVELIGLKLTSLDVSKNVALKNLSCYGNQLASLDVSKNILLERLWFGENQIANMDVSKNLALKSLDCGDNQLKSLDVSKNLALQELSCDNNQLTSLDVSKNVELKDLECEGNHLTVLNIANGNNKNFEYMYASNNPNLTCIQIDSGFTPWDVDLTSGLGWKKDSHASYSTNCNYNLSINEVKPENAIQILNPVKDNLVIKTTAKVEKVEIYNTAGQLVKVLFKGNTQVQDLVKGVYIVKITTDKGIITQKIIKQ